MGRDPSLGPHGHGEDVGEQCDRLQAVRRHNPAGAKNNNMPARGGPELQVVWRVQHVGEEAEMSRSHEQAPL